MEAYHFNTAINGFDYVIINRTFIQNNHNLIKGSQIVFKKLIYFHVMEFEGKTGIRLFLSISQLFSNKNIKI